MKAIGYIRISTKDQSHFSIQGQSEYIANYCKTHKYDLVSSFVDDGKSAKNFDRPDWKKLEQFVKSNKVDYLIVMKYDRFSRNLSESLQKLEMLENKFKIRVISVMEPIGIHPMNPMYIEVRTSFLLRAQTELLIIRDRTKLGINVAQREGRYLSSAPFGYKNARDNKDRPVIEIDEIRAPIIKGIFERYIHGESPAAILKWARVEGFTLKGKSAIVRVLTNPVYAGLIKVAKYYDDPEKLVKGMHTGIISEQEFYKVANIIANGNKQPKTIISDNVPLRGKALCFCGRPLTAGRSKGKKIYVWYYKCSTHTKHNLNAVKLNTQIQEVFNNLSLPDRITNAVKAGVESYLSNYSDLSTKKVQGVGREVRSLQKQIESLEEKYINNVFEYEAYQKWKAKYNAELSDARAELFKLQQTPSKLYDIDSLVNMGSIYQKASTTDKQALVGAVFNNRLYYSEGFWRTPFLLNLFAPKAASLQEKRLILFDEPYLHSPNRLICTPDGT